MDYEDFLPVLNKTAKNYLEKVQSLVEYCTYCQPYDGGDCIWVMGEQTTLNEIFDELDVPEKYREDIAAHVTCPNCGKSGFEPWEDVGKEERYHKEIRDSIKNAEKKFGKSINELQEHIENFPSLAQSTKLGRKIYKEIMSGSMPERNINGNWFRARLVKDQKVFDCNDMNVPPTGKAGDGRYHHSGQSVLYIAESEPIAIGEVLGDYFTSALLWIQEYEVNGINKILDLRNDWDSIYTMNSSLLVALLSRRLIDKKVEDRNSTWKPEYFITHFIADCARLAGYNGISYSSTRSYGNNVVLFNLDKTKVKEKGKPRVIIHDPPKIASGFNGNIEDLLF